MFFTNFVIQIIVNLFQDFTVPVIPHELNNDTCIRRWEVDQQHLFIAKKSNKTTCL